MGAGASALQDKHSQTILDAWPRVPLAQRTRAHAEAASIIDAAVETTYDVTVTS